MVVYGRPACVRSAHALPVTNLPRTLADLLHLCSTGRRCLGCSAVVVYWCVVVLVRSPHISFNAEHEATKLAPRTDPVSRRRLSLLLNNRARLIGLVNYGFTCRARATCATCTFTPKLVL
jgi:hypothetical protein